MSHLSEQLSSLRREIADLQNRNVQYSENRDHSPREESALELRTIRLLQIKQELSKMFSDSGNHTVWWDKLRQRDRAA